MKTIDILSSICKFKVPELSPKAIFWQFEEISKLNTTPP